MVREPRNRTNDAPQTDTSEAPMAPPIPAQRAPVGNETHTVKDSRGRTLTVKKLTLLEEMDLLAAAGADNSANTRWMFYASLASCVRSIDGELMGPALTTRILRGNLQQVGSDGIAAVAKVFAAELPDDEPGSDDVAAAKN